MTGSGFPLPIQDRVTSSPLCAFCNPLLGVFAMLGGSVRHKKKLANLMMTYEDSYCLDTLELIAEHFFFRVSKSLVGFSLHFSQLIFILIFTKPQRNRGMQYTLMYRNCIYMMDGSTWENDDEFILHSRPLLATPLINLLVYSFMRWYIAAR